MIRQFRDQSNSAAFTKRQMQMRASLAETNDSSNKNDAAVSHATGNHSLAQPVSKMTNLDNNESSKFAQKAVPNEQT